MSAVRLAVVGAGMFGRKHIDTIRHEPLAELVAVADPVAPADFQDYREMLDRVKPEGVVVATPNAAHVPVGLACVERRIPILVEKPLAETIEASTRLVEAA